MIIWKSEYEKKHGFLKAVEHTKIDRLNPDRCVSSTPEWYPFVFFYKKVLKLIHVAITYWNNEVEWFYLMILRLIWFLTFIGWHWKKKMEHSGRESEIKATFEMFGNVIKSQYTFTKL